jgi:hypothetical protein
MVAPSGSGDVDRDQRASRTPDAGNHLSEDGSPMPLRSGPFGCGTGR